MMKEFAPRDVDIALTPKTYVLREHLNLMARTPDLYDDAEVVHTAIEGILGLLGQLEARVFPVEEA